MLSPALGLLFTLLTFAVVIAVVVAVVRARRNHADSGRDDFGHEEAGLGTVRRLFLYGVGMLALLFAGVGLSLLLGGALDAVGGDTVISESDSQLALSLAFCIVGIPAWLLVAVLAQRSLLAAPNAERASEARRFYLNLARGLALVIVAVSGLAVARFALGLDDFDGTPWGWLLVWGLLWLVHDRVIGSEPAMPQTRWLDRAYLGFGSVFGLYFLLNGIATAANSLLSGAYDAVFRSALVSGWSTDLRAPLASVIVGVCVWVPHWSLRLQREDRRSAAWQVVVFLFGVLPGLALTLVPAATALHAVLQWWIGEPIQARAVDHFAHLPGSAALVAVGLATWVYYRAVLSEDRADGSAQSGPERLYRYLVAAAGLVVLSAGIVIAVGLAIEAAAPTGASIVRSSGWWRDQLVLAITLVAVGAPVWAAYWFGVQRVVARAVVERAALPRRVYLFAIFGVATVTLLVDLTIVLFRVLDAALGSGLTSEVIVDSRWSAALVIAAGVIAGYHWAVLREDQAASPATEQVRHRVRDIVLLLPAGAEAPPEEFAALPDIRLGVWRRTEGADIVPPTPDAWSALRARLLESDADCLVVVSDSGGFEVVPFEVAARPS